MSITRLLVGNVSIKQLFATIPNLKESFIGMGGDAPFPSKPQIIVQRESRANPVIGHAYDYLLRAYVQRLNGAHQERESDHLAASIAVNILDQKHIHDAYKGIVERRNAYISERSGLTGDVIRDAIVLGQMEQYYRSGVGDIPALLHTSYEDIHDLQALIEATQEHYQRFQATRGIVCNPYFGEAISALVDGADGDLIIDNTLIDIKTESDFRWKIGQSRQLIAYWILSCLSPGFTPEIKQLAIWNPRYCRLVSIETADICRAINMIEFMDAFIAIITADHFEGSEHLSSTQRQRFVEIIREAWSDADNTLKQYYR